MTESTAPDLLEGIISLRANVGDGLTDDELTRLLLHEALPSECGFTFVSLSDGCATFRVPPQDPANWYPEKGWIAPEKESLAKVIAGGCGLSLYKPPDEHFSYKPPGTEPHHHLEMGTQSVSIVFAHPRYLKIRLFDLATSRPLALPRDLLERLAPLYLEQSSSTSAAMDPPQAITCSMMNKLPDNANRTDLQSTSGETLGIRRFALAEKTLQPAGCVAKLCTAIENTIYDRS
jgi:hypothetical protein